MNQLHQPTTTTRTTTRQTGSGVFMTRTSSFLWFEFFLSSSPVSCFVYILISFFSLCFLLLTKSFHHSFSCLISNSCLITSLSQNSFSIILSNYLSRASNFLLHSLLREVSDELSHLNYHWRCERRWQQWRWQHWRSKSMKQERYSHCRADESRREMQMISWIIGRKRITNDEKWGEKGNKMNHEASATKETTPQLNEHLDGALLLLSSFTISIN